MPTYEFRCPDGHTFERFYRSISGGESEVPCPECGKTATRRMSAGAGLLFKGSGFYLTDYGKNAHRSSGSAPQKSDTGSGGSSDSGSSSATTTPAAASGDSKPAAKPEAKPATPPSKPKSDK